MNAPHDRLDELLQQWKVRDELPSDLRRRVWQRVEGGRGGSWAGPADSWLAPVPVPVLAAGVLLLAVAGGWAGKVAATAERPKTTQAMAEAYLNSIDPEVRSTKS